MQKAAKWALIIWSVICLGGILFGLGGAGENLQGPMTDAEQAGAGIGIACGMGMWLVCWAAVAGPALVIYIVSGKKKDA